MIEAIQKVYNEFNRLALVAYRKRLDGDYLRYNVQAREIEYEFGLPSIWQDPAPGSRVFA